MSANSTMNKAKDAKNDEFYTQISDIEKELKHYREHFKGATVLCNCDDPEYSNFWKYFHLNFEFLGLKKLITTHYDPSEPTYKMVYEGGNDNDISVGVITPLKTNGDFRSPECIELLKEASIVVTNPPFSLFREYVAQLFEYEKSFIIWGNNNAISYKELFPLMQHNEMWLGYTANQTCAFRVVDGYKYDEKLTKSINDGFKYGKVPAISVFTNLDIAKRHEFIDLVACYSADKYPHYDNYDAIEVGKVLDIPCDYFDVMGVPITFMSSYNPLQFEIVGTVSAASDPGTLNLGNDYSKHIGYNQDRTPNGRTGSTFGKCPVLIKDDKKHPYYEKDGVRVQATYPRIFIRRKDVTGNEN